MVIQVPGECFHIFLKFSQTFTQYQTKKTVLTTIENSNNNNNNGNDNDNDNDNEKDINL